MNTPNIKTPKIWVNAEFQRLLDTHKILRAKHVAFGAEHEKRGNFVPQHFSVFLHLFSPD